MNDFILKLGVLVLSLIGFGCIYFFFNAMRRKENQNALSSEDVPPVIAENKDKQLNEEELQKRLNYKKILKETGTLLYQILELTDREEMDLILPKVEKISHILYENGCYGLFADDKRVLASEELQVDFLAVEDEIEIPGFYSFVDGKYDLLGDCQGMKKEL